MTTGPSKRLGALPGERPTEAATVRWRQAGESRSVAVKTLAHNGEILEIESPEALLAGKTVWLMEGSAVSQCVVVSCGGTAGRRLVTLRYLHAGRRRENRDQTLGTGVAEWQSTNGGRESVRAAVRNLSDGGMQLLARRPIERGVFLRLQGDQFECQGFVRYCTHDDDGDYRIGLQFSQSPYDRRSLDYRG